MLNIDLKKWMRNPFLKDSFWTVFGNEKTFTGTESTLIILLLATIPTTLANVYVANLLANNRKWTLSILRISRDTISILSLYFVLLYTNGINASYNYAIINTIVATLFFINTFIATKKIS